MQGGAAIILQAANTGLTGGSTPDGDDYDRPIVLVSTLRLTGIQLLNEGRQVLCLPGATLDRLEQTLAPLGREPHSVIGSSCIGASVLGGICNNSGGALVRRGPAYTELALYAQVDAQASCSWSTIWASRCETPEQILQRLQAGDYWLPTWATAMAAPPPIHAYAEDVRRVDADTPARFNADPSRHFEAAGSAGKLAVFAVRLDTFEKEAAEVFYIGSNRIDSLTAIRRQLLTGFERLPIAGEYIHRDAYDIGERYGKRQLPADRPPGHCARAGRVRTEEPGRWLVRTVGPARHRPVMQGLTGLLPSHLPKRMGEFRQRYEHHLLLKVSAQDAAQTEAWLRDLRRARGGYFHCMAEEGQGFPHRCRNAAVRYREVHRAQVQDIVALDIALRRDDADWFEQLPADLDGRLLHALLRPLPVPRVPPGLHRAQGRGPDGDRACDVGAAGPAWRRISGRTQCRPPVPGQAGAGGVLPAAGPEQYVQPRYRPDLESEGLGYATRMMESRAHARLSGQTAVEHGLPRPGATGLQVGYAEP